MIVIKGLKNTVIVSVLFIVDMLLSVQSLLFVKFILENKFGRAGFENRHIIAFVVFLVFFFIMYDQYASMTEEVFAAGISAVLSVTASFICTFFVSVFLKWELLTVSAWLAEFGLTWVLLVCWRTLAASLIRKFGEKRSFLIIENMRNTSRLARKLKYASDKGRDAVYYMIDEDNSAEIDTLIEEKLKNFDSVFISPAISEEISNRIMHKAFVLGKDISILADLDGVSTLHGRIYQLDDTPVIEKKGVYMSRLQRFVKRGFDIVISVILGIVSLPIALICAVAIKLDSDGPVIYKQERYTIHKKVFTIYKFRTMVQDAEKNGAQFATEDDPRITKVGKVLRATRLDELPQLYNILMGHMSIVGPRPERPVFADYFSETVKNYDMRFCVKAGLTGYAHVYGKYNTRMSDRILMDIIYIVNYSILTDIKIMLLTVQIMFIKSAAEGIDEEYDKIMSSEENEKKRREETLRHMGDKDENIYHHTGV